MRTPVTRGRQRPCQTFGANYWLRETTGNLCGEATDDDVEKTTTTHSDLTTLDRCVPRMKRHSSHRQIAESRRETDVLSISTYDPDLIVDQIKQAAVVVDLFRNRVWARN